MIDKAIATLSDNGVTFVDIDGAVFDELIEQISAHSTLDYKQNMEAYFQQHAASAWTPVMAMAESGIYHEFIDRYLPFINMLESPVDQAQVAIKQQWMAMLNAAVAQVLASHDLDGLIHPTVHTVAAKLGETQHGMSGRLSCFSGVPLLTLPIGFTASGLPVGLSIIGETLSDERLVAMAYAMESVLDARAAPIATPMLLGGRAPAPIAFTTQIDDVVAIDMELNVSRHTLRYQTKYLTKNAIYAVCLHRAKHGPIIQCLSGLKGVRSQGELRLTRTHMALLRQGESYVRVYSKTSPKGEQSKRVVF